MLGELVEQRLAFIVPLVTAQQHVPDQQHVQQIKLGISGCSEKPKTRNPYTGRNGLCPETGGAKAKLFSKWDVPKQVIFHECCLANRQLVGSNTSYFKDFSAKGIAPNLNQ